MSAGGSEPGEGTVLVTSRSFGSGRVDPVAFLEAHGLSVRRGDAGHGIEALAPLLGDAVAWIAGAAPVEEHHLDHATQLRLVVRYGTGVEAVDHEAMHRRGIILARTPGANAEAVADHTIGLLLAVLRGTVDADRRVREGHWSAAGPGREVSACTVGIVGYGQIGRAVHQRLRGFGCEVLVSDPRASDDLDVTLVALDEMLPAADVLTLHLPGQPEPLLDAAALGRLKPGSVVINTARAGLIDEGALAEALRSGGVAGAGLDVLGAEGEAVSLLLDAPNVVVTPHIAGQTIEAIDRMGKMAAEEVVRVVVDGAAPCHQVNLSISAGPA